MDHLLCVFIKRFYCVLEFIAVEPLAIDESPYLCDDLDDSFDSRFFASYVIKMCLLCKFEGCRNES